jgi:23S rRNA (adenine2030-N6)-methyltransferase
VLVDPPFEADSDFSNLVTGLAAAYRKWATGIYALWYPVKGRREADMLAKRLGRLGVPKVLRAEILVEPLGDPARLNGAGMILVNPPWTLEKELSALLPALIQVFGGAGKPGFRLDWLTPRPAPDRR